MIKKILFIVLFLFLCSKAEAATRTIDSDATNWSASTSWVEGAVPTTADAVVANASSASITIDTTTAVCSTMILTDYTGTMTFTAGQKLTVVTTCTFVAGMTIAGTGTLQLNNSATITSGGLTFPGSLIFDAGTWTLADNWDVDGNITFQYSLNTLNGNQMNVGGSFSINADVAGTTDFVLDGTGTLSSSATGNSLSSNLTINTAGTITIGTYFVFEDDILTYTAGTVDASTNSSDFRITDNCTLNINGINWYNITFDISSNETITLGSNLTCTNNLTLMTTSDILTTAGAYDIFCANFSMNADSTWNMKSSETLTISNAMYLDGSSTTTTTMKAVTASTAFLLNYTGTAANCQVYEMTFTDVNASGSAQVIDNWYGGTLTRTTNITNRTSADIGGDGGVGSISVSTNF